MYGFHGKGYGTDGLGGPGSPDIGVKRTMASDTEFFCLKWNNFRPTLLDSFEASYDEEEFVDVTISVEGKTIKAHKVFLSACSPYFKQLFMDLPAHSHPVIVLKDTRYHEVRSLLNFIYHGEIEVKQEDLPMLLGIAKMLEIRGLSGDCINSLEAGLSHKTPPMEREDLMNQRHMNSVPEAMHYGLHNTGLYNMPGCPPMPHLDQSGHKRPMHRSSPNPKRPKMPSRHSPHERPKGHHTPHRHTPPHLGMPRGTPPSVTPCSSTSPMHSEEDTSKVVNLSVNNGHSSSGQDTGSPPLVITKVEVEEDSGGTQSSGASVPPDERESEEHHTHDDDSKDHDTMPEMPPLSHMPLHTYANYAMPHESFPGPSGVLASPVGEPDWRHREPPPHPGDCDGGPQRRHPVINELLGGGESGVIVAGGGVGGSGGGGSTGGTGGGSYGGKKAVPSPCPVCHKVLSNAYNMRVHLETHQNISYKCIVCGIISRTRDTMRKHCSNVHKLRQLELKKAFKQLRTKGSPPTTPTKSRPKDLSLTYPPFDNLSSLLIPKCEPLPTMVPTTSANLELAERSAMAAAMNMAKGSLQSIVSKLIQKQ